MENSNFKGKLASCIRIKNFSISFLAIVLGLTGFTLAILKAESILGWSLKISSYLLYFSIIIFGIIALLYIAKIILFPKEVKKEFYHPIKINFFPIIAKVFLILSLIYLGSNLIVSGILWWVGVIIQFLFSIIILSIWIRFNKFKIHHINPAWFIPIVGNLIIPIAGVQHSSPEISWFFFSIGIIWWIVLFVIVINRIIFHHPIQDKLLPTLFILLHHLQ